jgi:hypothetical protein
LRFSACGSLLFLSIYNAACGGERVKSTVTAILIVFLLWTVLYAESGRGTVCVAPNSEKPPTRTSPGQDYNPATLLLKIDDRDLVHWPHKESLKIDDLDTTKRHLVVLTSDGKRIQSFWFRFSDFKVVDLCMDFDGYEGVQLHDRRGRPWCKCK